VTWALDVATLLSSQRLPSREVRGTATLMPDLGISAADLVPLVRVIGSVESNASTRRHRFRREHTVDPAIPWPKALSRGVPGLRAQRKRHGPSPPPAVARSQSRPSSSHPSSPPYGPRSVQDGPHSSQVGSLDTSDGVKGRQSGDEPPLTRPRADSGNRGSVQPWWTSCSGPSARSLMPFSTPVSM
jgi:hypothetical protein